MTCLKSNLTLFKQNSSPIIQSVSTPNQQGESSDLCAILCLTENMCSNLTETSSSDPDVNDPLQKFELPDSEKDWMEYFLGYIVHKFYIKYPFLGYVSDGKLNDYIYVSLGGLKRMKAPYSEAFVALELIFRKYHGSSLQTEYESTPKLTRLCEGLFCQLM